MGPNWLPIQLAPEAFTYGKAVGAWIWQIASTGVEVKKEWSYTSTAGICHHGVNSDSFSDYTFNTYEFFLASIRGFHTILRIKSDYFFKQSQLFKENAASFRTVNSGFVNII